MAIARRVPLPIGRSLGRALGSTGWLLVARYRRKAFVNITRAFPEWPERQRRATVRKMFRHLGETLFEVLWLTKGDTETRRRLTVVENSEPVAAALQAGRAIVVLSGHCGNWEWGARTVADLGPMTVLQREREDPELNQLIREMRAMDGIHTIDRGSAKASRELIQATRRSGTLVFLIDQNIRAESAKVPFFGIPALTPLGPVKLAVRTGAMIVTILIERRDGRIHARFHDLVDTKRTDDPIALTARFTADIEQQIRRTPEQWVWMHDRWRDRPQWDVANRKGGADGSDF